MKPHKYPNKRLVALGLGSVGQLRLLPLGEGDLGLQTLGPGQQKWQIFWWWVRPVKQQEKDLE